MADTVMLCRLMHSDGLSGVRGQFCMLGRSADAGLTADKIFKSRDSAIMDLMCVMSKTEHGKDKNVLQ